MSNYNNIEDCTFFELAGHTTLVYLLEVNEAECKTLTGCQRSTAGLALTTSGDYTTSLGRTAQRLGQICFLKGIFFQKLHSFLAFINSHTSSIPKKDELNNLEKVGGGGVELCL